MFLLIEDICTYRGYKLDTFFLASAIADHFLEQLYKQNRRAPNLITLSISCLFIAAKMEQPICPILANFVTVMRQRHEVEITREAVIELEARILTELNFDVRFVSPLRFLERFQRILEVDKEDEEVFS